MVVWGPEILPSLSPDRLDSSTRLLSNGAALPPWERRSCRTGWASWWVEPRAAPPLGGALSLPGPACQWERPGSGYVLLATGALLRGHVSDHSQKRLEIKRPGK